MGTDVEETNPTVVGFVGWELVGATPEVVGKGDFQMLEQIRQPAFHGFGQYRLKNLQ